MCKTKELAGLVSGETASWFTDGVFQLCIPIWQKREMGLSRVPLIGALMSFMKPHPHDLISSKRSSSQNCHIGVQFQHMVFRGHRHQHLQQTLCDSLQYKFLFHLLSFAAELRDSGINMHCFHFITSYSLLNFLQSDFTLTSLLKLLFERSK